MAKRYKCPYCELRLIRKDLIKHIDKKHEELIPQGYSSARLVYNQVNKIDHGKCRVCGKLTSWNEKSGRYNVLCDNPKCKEHMREEYKKNMLRVRGTYNILNDPEQQKKMLANRSISGSYKFSDGGILTYTGSYEKKCLEFMDVVMQIPSKDILSPGPTIEYEYNGRKHFYITDFYYIPYNLIIEVKDGGDNLNNKDSSSMRASREKTIEKERIITDRGEYNYIRLTNNDFSQLLDVFMTIKEKLLEGDVSKTYKINESVIFESAHSKYDIEKQVKRIAEKVKKDKKDPTGNQNCMLCTWCMEAWFRGYNILPRPVYSPTDIIFTSNYEPHDIIKNNSEVIHFRNKNELKNICLSSGNNSRYYIHINWIGSSGGHEFILINIDDSIYVIDAQQGLFENIDFSNKASNYFNNINYNNSYIIRMDDKQFNYKLLKYNDNKYIKNFTEDDMKYIDESVIFESAHSKYDINNLNRLKRTMSESGNNINMLDETSLTEACKDVETARKFLQDVDNLSKKYDANFFIVTDGASMTRNGRGKSEPAVKNARDSQIEWEKKNGGDPDEDWLKHDNDLIKKEYAMESVIFNTDDIYYNKDKFDSGEINLCFITGFSGSGKSTMANEMEKNGIEKYELDDIVFQFNFSDENLKEYGGMISSFFNGPGKKYRTIKGIDDLKTDKEADDYQVNICIDFIDYAKKYAASHKDKKFIVEGVEIFGAYIDKIESFKDYAVYIKGTSLFNSYIRSAKRDSQDAETDFGKFKSFMKMIASSSRFKQYLTANTRLNKIKKQINKYVTESEDKSELTKGFKSKTSNVQYKTLSIDKPEIYDYLKDHFSKNNPMWEGVKDSKTYMDCFINGNNSRHIKRVGEIFINKVNDEVIGFEVVEKPNNYLAIEIPDKKYRGYGFGSLLLEDAIKKHGCKKLYVAADNKIAIKMYTNRGFEKTGEFYDGEYWRMELKESSINESDIEQIIFNKKQPFQKQITLYHGTDISNLDILIPNSYNVGRKNDVPKMSSFWFANKDYAESFASMTLIEKYNYNLLILLDNDMKVLIDKNYKDDIIKFLKSTKGYVYEKTIDISIVGYGHEGIFPEYTLDIPVKPDKRHIIMPNNLIKRIKFVPNDYLQDIKNKYKSGKMNFGSNFIQQILDKIIYYQSMVQRTKKIKDVRQLSVSDINNDIYYRVTYNNIGIYEAFKQNVPWNVWVDFKNSKACNWLPLPPKYEDGYYSYFTYEGYKKFMDLTYPKMLKYLNKDKIETSIVELDENSIVYSDKYQIVATNNNYMIESEDKSELTKGFKSKISNIQYKTLSIDKPEIYDYLKNYFSKNDPMWEGVKDSKTYMDCFINGNNSRNVKRVGEVLINKSNDEVIGYEVVEKPDNFLAIEIPNKKYRGYGFGNMLLEDSIKKHGCRKLYVAIDNKIALKMYKNKGFKIIKKWYDDEYYLMELKESSINELCTINTSNTFIQTYIRLFVDYIQKKYKSNIDTIDIKIVHSKQAIEMKKKKLKYINYSNDFIVINYNQITIVDEDVYGDQPINYNSFLKFHIAKVLLSTYACDDNTRLINAICTYESGIYNEIGEKTSEFKDAGVYADYLKKHGPNMVVNNLIKRSHTEYPIF